MRSGTRPVNPSLKPHSHNQQKRVNSRLREMKQTVNSIMLQANLEKMSQGQMYGPLVTTENMEYQVLRKVAQLKGGHRWPHVENVIDPQCLRCNKELPLLTPAQARVELLQPKCLEETRNSSTTSSSSSRFKECCSSCSELAGVEAETSGISRPPLRRPRRRKPRRLPPRNPKPSGTGLERDLGGHRGRRKSPKPSARHELPNSPQDVFFDAEALAAAVASKLLLAGDVEENPGPNPAPTAGKRRRRGRKAGKAPSDTQVVPVQAQQNAKGVRNVLRARQSGGQFKPPMPRMYAGLTPHSQQFIRAYLDPNGESTLADDDSRVPDGAVPSSALVAPRQITTVVCPFQTSDSGLLSNQMWTLISWAPPFLRTAVFLIAVDRSGDISYEEQDSVAEYLSTVPACVEYPAWHAVTSSVMVSSIRWTMLQGLTINPAESSNLLSQYRIVGKGITCYHNTPDLVNQGVYVGVQQARDSEEIDGVTQAGDFVGAYDRTVSVAFSAASSSNPDVIATTSDPTTGNTLQFVRVATTDGSTQWNTSPFSFRGFSGDTSQVAITNTSPAGDTSTTADLTYGNEYHFFVRRARNDDGTYSWQYGLRDSTNNANATDAYLARSVQANVNISMSGTHSFLLRSPPTLPSGWLYRLPPLTTEDVLQLSTQSDAKLMKSGNGWYMRSTIWQPIFNMQAGDSHRNIKFARPGVALDPEATIAVGGHVDSYDLNHGNLVCVMAGIPYACAPTFKCRAYIELVATSGSPWQSFMHSTPPVDRTIVELARDVTDHSLHVYDARYNCLGWLGGAITKLLGSTPLGMAVQPLVNSLLGGARASEEGPKQEGQLEKLLNQLIAHLGSLGSGAGGATGV